MSLSMQQVAKETWAAYERRLERAQVPATQRPNYTYVENNGGYQQKLIVTGAKSLLTNRNDFYLGHGSFTIPLSPTEPLRFFRLHVE